MTFLNNKNFMILGFEIFLFSGVFGIAYHSWLVFGLMFLGLFLLMNISKNTVYMVITMSLIWGFIAFSIGYSSGEWSWAVILGGIFFLLGVGAHMIGLKRSWDGMMFFGYSNTGESGKVSQNLN